LANIKALHNIVVAFRKNDSHADGIKARARLRLDFTHEKVCEERKKKIQREIIIFFFFSFSGGFVVQQERVGRIVMPAGLATTDLKPYVSKRTPLITASPPNFEELRDAMIAAHNGTSPQQEN
jgi:hypothetical protein